MASHFLSLNRIIELNSDYAKFTVNQTTNVLTLQLAVNQKSNLIKRCLVGSLSTIRKMSIEQQQAYWLNQIEFIELEEGLTVSAECDVMRKNLKKLFARIGKHQELRSA